MRNSEKRRDMPEDVKKAVTDYVKTTPLAEGPTICMGMEQGTVWRC